MENNNITNCYHFCWFNQNGTESKIKAFLIKGNNCSCLNNVPGEAFSTEVKCPNKCSDCRIGVDNSLYAVYEIDDTYNLTANQIAGCGSVQPIEKKATFADCSEEKGAYCTALSNVDGTQLKQNEDMTWDKFNLQCGGHLASLNEIGSVQPKSIENISPTSRFWVGHRIWSYINYQFDPKLLTSSISTKCGYFNQASGNIEFGSCLENYIYECQEKDATREATIGKTTKQENITSNDNPYFKSTRNDGHAETQEPSQVTNIVIGGIAGTVILLTILVITIFIKGRKARHIKPKPDASALNLIEKQKQPVYDETHPENEYDHLHVHQDTHSVGDVNMYDVSIPCADVTNIGGDIYNTSKDFDCDKTYDYSTHNNCSKVDNTMLNDDQYGTIPAGT